MKTLTILLLSVLATSAHAQQRGYYWDGYRWSCQVDCLRRGEPPSPIWPSERRIPDLYREYRDWGGRNKQICYRPNGQAYYCYY